jgi:hypothetical protein
MKKLEHTSTAGGTHHGTAAMENSIHVLLKTKNRNTISFSDSTSQNTNQKIQNMDSTGIFYSGILRNSPKDHE